MEELNILVDEEQKEESSIKIIVGSEEPGEVIDTTPDAPIQQQDKAKSSLKMKMNIRRALDGSIMVFGHKDIDIIVSPTKMKVFAFTKGEFSDHVYGTQNRFFEFLTKKGLIEPES